MTRISPSILSADFGALGAAVDNLKSWGADYVHIDVMDGSFVPNITFGHGMCNALRKHTTLPFDVHLMVENPLFWVPTFKGAGADIFTFHVEADKHIHRTIGQIHTCNMKAGVALNPATSLSTIEYILDDCDLVLLMSVNPGAPAQKFINSTIDKISKLNDLILARGLSTLIEVDGGINTQTAQLCVDAGADILVAGNSVFSSDDPKDMIRRLRCEVD